MTEYHESMEGSMAPRGGDGIAQQNRPLPEPSLYFLTEVEPALRGTLREITPTLDTIEQAICDAHEIIARAKPSSEALSAAMNGAKDRTERRIADFFVQMLKLEFATSADVSDAGRRAAVARLVRAPGQRFMMVPGGKE